MCNLNEVTLMGRLGKESKVLKTDENNNASFVRCQIATSEYWKHNGETHDHTEWHTIEISGSQAKFAAEHLSKGDSVFVKGRLRTKNWENKQGEKFTATVIKADNFQLLSKKSQTAKKSDQGSDSFDEMPIE